MKNITAEDAQELREYARLLEGRGLSREVVVQEVAMRMQCGFHSHGRAEYRCVPGTPGVTACNRRLTNTELVIS